MATKRKTSTKKKARKKAPQSRSGTRSSGGRFAPGESGNPGGRPKVVAEVRRIAQEKSLDALEILWDIATDEKEKAHARIAALKEILDRGLGKAPQAIEVTGGFQTPIRIDLSGFTDDELENLKILAKKAHAPSS